MGQTALTQNIEIIRQSESLWQVDPTPHFYLPGDSTELTV